MIGQAPCLFIILCPTANVVAATKRPDHPSRLPLRHQLAQARCVYAVIAVVGLAETKLSEDHGHPVHCLLASRAETVVPKATFDATAVCGGILVVVHLEHKLVRILVVGEEELLAVAQIVGPGDGL